MNQEKKFPPFPEREIYELLRDEYLRELLGFLAECEKIAFSELWKAWPSLTPDENGGKELAPLRNGGLVGVSTTLQALQKIPLDDPKYPEVTFVYVTDLGKLVLKVYRSGLAICGRPQQKEEEN